MKYEIYQKEQFKEFEDICNRCGQCCGSHNGDSCSRLALDQVSGKYYCTDYKKRFGLQTTKSGKVFYCIPIIDIIRHSQLRPDCAYNKIT